MTELDLRIECYRLAHVAIQRLSDVAEDRRTIANRFIGFARGESVRHEALRMALAEANNRSSVDDVLMAAASIVMFVENKQPAAPQRVVRKKGTKKKTRSRHPA